MEKDMGQETSLEIRKLEEDLFVVSYRGEDGLTEFLNRGGASSDEEVIRFVQDWLSLEDTCIQMRESSFGCSTISARGSQGKALFGRNFDWNPCEAWIVQSEPACGYASISTVNMDFIGENGEAGREKLPETVRVIAALYAPLDGMNEKGLCVSVNMIQDTDGIGQKRGKTNLTTTTAIRLLLNRAANVEEALELLAQYDLHGSLGMMVHFALADVDGNCVVAEYIGNELTITETPIVTNHYLAAGEKYGIGSDESKLRFGILEETMKRHKMTDMEAIRDALCRVSKSNFNSSFAATEWSIVYNQDSGEVRFYHRENYDHVYPFTVKYS